MCTASAVRTECHGSGSRVRAAVQTTHTIYLRAVMSSAVSARRTSYLSADNVFETAVTGKQLGGAAVGVQAALSARIVASGQMLETLQNARNLKARSDLIARTFHWQTSLENESITGSADLNRHIGTGNKTEPSAKRRKLLSDNAAADELPLVLAQDAAYGASGSEFCQADAYSQYPFACNKCEYRCARHDSLTAHKGTHVRAADRPFACDQCEYRCAQRSALTQHNRIHSGERPFACDQCEYRCAQKSAMTRHKRAHSGERPFACDKCEYRCAQRSALARHRHVHSSERPFACDQCDRRCASSSDLNVHKRTHSGERPFACDKCKYRSARSDTLTAHKRVHSGERPFACDKCDHRCTGSSALARHMRSHSGERPFACNQCTYRCGQSGTLTRHKRIHSGE